MTGVPASLVQVWVDHMPDSWGITLKVTRLAHTLHALAEALPAPGMSLVAAARWCALVAIESEDGALPLAAVARRVQAWPQALWEDGWLYAAAGMSLAEAAQRQAAGTLPDREQVVLLAALRGVRLPVS